MQTTTRNSDLKSPERENMIRFTKGRDSIAQAVTPEGTVMIDENEWDRTELRILVRDLDGNWFDSSSTQDWPAIEQFLPREQWPEEVHAGQRCKSHAASPELRAILDDYFADQAEED